MIRLNLSIQKRRGQCYDGCSTISGIRTGIAKRISDEEPRAVFTHCYGHSLNLACNDIVKKSKFVKQALETTQEIQNSLNFHQGVMQFSRSLRLKVILMWKAKPWGFVFYVLLAGLFMLVLY